MLASRTLTASLLATRSWKGFSDSLQSRFPGARFTLTAVTSIGDAIRASWTFGPPERPDAVTGMDFVIPRRRQDQAALRLRRTAQRLANRRT